MAGAEVIERDPYPQLSQVTEDFHGEPHVAHRHVFGDLQLETLGIETGIGQHRSEGLYRISILELPRREVYRHPQRRQARFLPGFRLRTCCAEHPLVQRNDQFGLFRHGDEFSGEHQAPLWVLPAYEGFHADDLSGANVLLRLVVDDELFVPQRAPQLLLQRQPRGDFGVHGGAVELEVVSALILGAVHGHIGVLQQRLAILAVVGPDGDANAGRHDELAAAKRPGLLEAIEDSPGDIEDVLFANDFRQKDGELVAAHAGHGIAVPQEIREPLAGALQ